jgi:hypothetical protein
MMPLLRGYHSLCCTHLTRPPLELDCVPVMSVSGMSSISSRPSRPSVRPLYTEAVDQRPPLSTMQKINAFNFVVLLCFGILMVNLTQFMMLPMAAIPHPVAKQTYQDGIRYTKASFGYLLSTCHVSLFVGVCSRHRSPHHSMVWSHPAGVDFRG